jgi:hypothetical protein
MRYNIQKKLNIKTSPENFCLIDDRFVPCQIQATDKARHVEENGTMVTHYLPIMPKKHHQQATSVVSLSHFVM